MVSGIVTFLLIVGGGVYFLTREEQKEDLYTQKNKLEGSLVTAKSKLQQEQNNLDSLKAGLKDSFPLAVGVQEQMRRASGLVGETDYLFSNPLGANPQLIFTSPLASLKINEQRAKINALLSEWKKKDNAVYLSKITLVEANNIQQEAETIKQFLEDFNTIIENLTVENSGLTQFQIDTYVYALPPIASIEEVIASMEELIENYTNPSSGVVAQVEEETSSSTVNWNTGPIGGSVTPEAVVSAEQAVAITIAEVVAIEEQLVIVNEQIQAQTPTTYVPPEETIIDPDASSSGTGLNTGNPNNPTSPTTPSSSTPAPSQGIVVQPGAPRLIQGSNPF